jgi:peptidoglycan/LPS O-acetylase OafA/YrhL
MAMHAIRPAWLRWCLPAALALFSVYFRSQGVEDGMEVGRLSKSVLAFFINFSVGILFAWVFVAHQTFIRRKSLLWDAVGLLSVVLMFLSYKPQYVMWKNLALNLCVLTFMASAFKGPMMNWFFTRPFVYVTGGMCYTIYLLHFAFLFFALGFTAGISTGVGYKADLFLQALIVLPAMFLVSAVFFLLIEKPCMDKHWPQRLLERLRQAAETGRT